MRILVVNGPNLNLLGKREPHIYGKQSFDDYLLVLRRRFPGIQIDYFQSNHEGALIDHLHETAFGATAENQAPCCGLVLNAGGLTHTSVALADAVSALPFPAVEVHISNVHARENFRHHSFLAPRCVGSIVGLGLNGYALAIEFLMTYQPIKA
jgi:3-dehydroquinate dehydratase II